MKKKIIYSFLLALFTLVGGRSQTLPANIQNYNELPNPRSTNAQLWLSMPDFSVTWGNTDTRYKKETPPATVMGKTTIQLQAWRGERVSCQWVVANKTADAELSYTIGDFIKNGTSNEKITSDNVFSGFVRYVMTDELNKDGKGGCGYRNNKNFDSSLVADPIDHRITSLKLSANQSQGVWVRINVPLSVTAGVYVGKISVKNKNNLVQELNVELNVSDRALPLPKDWSFHLDLWQNPFSVARIYNVPFWSAQHIEALKKEMKLYADAGGKVITASIIYDPWNGQTQDIYESMIQWTKKANGTWMYDFTVFDKWVELMMSLGVDKQISCFSMIPWNLSFRYFDEATNSTKTLVATPGDIAYSNHWLPFLKAFAAHLKEKNWFNITHIAMDERPIDQMQAAISVIRQADPNFKIALAGNLHNELITELNDYCVPLATKYSEQQMTARKSKGFVTTYYTCCVEPYPNTFTFSNPADAEWLGWYAAKAGLDGYLRWALNCWVINPLQDSRFRAWAAGDTYLLYPGERTSVRFERLVEGIQQYEKVRILRDLYTAEKRLSDTYLLDKLLADFNEATLSATTSQVIVNAARAALQNLLDKADKLNYDALKDAVDAAKKINTVDYPVGTTPGQYSVEKWNILQTEINNSSNLLKNANAQTQSEIDTALKKLLDAIQTFKTTQLAPFEYSTAEKPIWYQLADNRTPTSYMVRVDKDVVVNQLKWTTSNEPTNANQLFRFETAARNGFLMYNKANQNFPVSVSALDASCIAIENNADYDTWIWFSSAAKGSYVIALQDGLDSQQLNSYQSHNGKIGFWGPDPNDKGNQWRFLPSIAQSVNAAKAADEFFYVKNGVVYAKDKNVKFTLHNVSGQTIDISKKLPVGVYFVQTANNKITYKILVK